MVSYWAATLGAPGRSDIKADPRSETRDDYPPLRNDCETEVTIIGAGLTGLSAAWQLQKLGRDCVVLDMHRPGWGASGRNGGMAVPRYKSTFPELATRYGLSTAITMHAMAQQALDTLEKIAADVASDIGPTSFARVGHLTPILRDQDVARFERDVEWQRAEAGYAGARMLGRVELAAKLGTDYYQAAYFDPRAAGIHPLHHCLSLAAALKARGVRIYGQTPAMNWRRDGQRLGVDTPNGRVLARHVLIATNGYSDAQPAGDSLARRVVPVVSSLIATEPLPPALRARILHEGQLVTDAKRLTNYYRVGADGRFVFGGRGGASTRESAAIYRRLERDMHKIFPALAGLHIDYRWSGRVAVTLDGLPHIGALDDAGVLYALGYNGRGVALSALFGAAMARLAVGEAADYLSKFGPMQASPFAAIPFHGLRLPAKQAVITYYKLLDALGR